LIYHLAHYDTVVWVYF